MKAAIGAVVELWKASRAFVVSFDGDDNNDNVAQLPSSAASDAIGDSSTSSSEQSDIDVVPKSEQSDIVVVPKTKARVSWWRRIRFSEREQSASSEIDAAVEE